MCPVCYRWWQRSHAQLPPKVGTAAFAVDHACLPVADGARDRRGCSSARATGRSKQPRARHEQLPGRSRMCSMARCRVVTVVREDRDRDEESHGAGGHRPGPNGNALAPVGLPYNPLETTGTGRRKCLIRLGYAIRLDFCSELRRHFCLPTVGKCGARRGMSRCYMSASSGQKRRRRRDRRFISFHEVFSMRATILAVMATFGLLLLQFARTFLKA